MHRQRYFTILVCLNYDYAMLFILIFITTMIDGVMLLSVSPYTHNSYLMINREATPPQGKCGRCILQCCRMQECSQPLAYDYVYTGLSV